MDTTLATIKNQHGFTLIEVMIALVVLVIGVLGALSMQLLTIKGNSNAMAISRSVHETGAALDMAGSLDFTSNELTAGIDQAMTSLFASAPNFDGTLTYTVEDKDGGQINTMFGLTHDDFSGSKAKAKLIKLKATQRVAGEDKTIVLQFVKIDS